MTALEESLRRLRTDYIDLYMTHAINSIDRLRNPEWHAFTDRARQQGKIRHVGVSGHAGNLAECLEYALDEDMVDAMLVAYNFGQDPKFYERITRSFDMIATQDELPRLLQKAKTKDVGVVAMKTLMGARLNDMRPFENQGATYAQAAFRWVLSNPNVDALVISMTDRALIDEYLGASGATAVASTDLPLLQPSDPAAQGLGYVAQSSQADTAKYKNHMAGQACGNCSLFGGKPGDASGTCSIFPGRQVSAKGWCSAYVKKAG